MIHNNGHLGIALLPRAVLAGPALEKITKLVDSMVSVPLSDGLI